MAAICLGLNVLMEKITNRALVPLSVLASIIPKFCSINSKIMQLTHCILVMPLCHILEPDSTPVGCPLTNILGLLTCLIKSVT